MKKILIIVLLGLFSYEVALAHSGRTNSAGCHNNRKTGGYHCHGGGSSYSGSSTSSSSRSTYSTPSKSATPQTSDLVLQTQKYLNALGYDAGPEDGILGAKTRKAIKAFQNKISESADGSPSKSLLKKLELAANS